MRLYFLLSSFVFLFSYCVSKQRFEGLVQEKEQLSAQHKRLQQVHQSELAEKEQQLMAAQNELARLYQLSLLITDSLDANPTVDTLQYRDILAQAMMVLARKGHSPGMLQPQLEPSRQTFQMDSIRFLQQEIVKFHAVPGKRAAMELEINGSHYDVLLVNIQRGGDLRFFLEDQDGGNFSDFKNLNEAVKAEKQRLVFATNAGMFTPDFQPQGLFIEDGRLVTKLDDQMEGYGNFYLQPNGIFILTHTDTAHVIPTTEFKQYAHNIRFATQSGPMLVVDGAIHPAFTEGSSNKYIRSGVGVVNPYTLVFAISHQPVNFFDFATLFKDYFNCKNALYLDGAISKMFLPEIGRYELDGRFGPIIGLVEGR